jgi:hypothetical protein
MFYILILILFHKNKGGKGDLQHAAVPFAAFMGYSLFILVSDSLGARHPWPRLLVSDQLNTAS